MIGRAAMKNPFIFQQINEYLEKGTYTEVSDHQRLDCFFRYLDYTQLYPSIRFINIKMQAMNFTRGMKGGSRLRLEIGKVKNIEELKRLLTLFPTDFL